MLGTMPYAPLKMKRLAQPSLGKLFTPLSGKTMPLSAMRGDDGHELTQEQAMFRQRASAASRANVSQRKDRRK